MFNYEIGNCVRQRIFGEVDAPQMPQIHSLTLPHFKPTFNGEVMGARNAAFIFNPLKKILSADFEAFS